METNALFLILTKSGGDQFDAVMNYPFTNTLLNFFDPYNRKCMEWDPKKQNLDLLQFYQQLIQLRKEYPALRNGKLKFLLAKKNDHRLVYERWDNQNHFVIFINKREKPSFIKVPASTDTWVNMESSETIYTHEAHLNIKVPALGYVILKTINK
jgi:cyclomaltodextrinase